MAMWLGAGILILLIGVAAYVRLAPSDPARWNVDPMAISVPASPNFALIRPGRGEDQIYAVSHSELLKGFDEISMAEKRVKRLAGNPSEGPVTYIVRSALWGFPDYISVTAIPAEGGSQLAIFSRARFGYSDMGVNQARLEDWLAKLDQLR